MSIFQYAAAQARVRARLGVMPDEARWHYVADASDLNNLIERMRASGLAHWVSELPRSPDPFTIERRLQQQLQTLLQDVGRVLPDRWIEVRQWLNLAGNLTWVQRLLTESEIEPAEQIDAALMPIFSQPADARSKSLEKTRYRQYLATPLPFDRWLAGFKNVCPSVSGREAYVLRRLRKCVLRHRAQIFDLRQQPSGSLGAQWRLREDLARELRALIGGDPFHAGLILIYCLLELLQYERCRALLVAGARGWERPEILGSAA